MRHRSKFASKSPLGPAGALVSLVLSGLALLARPWGVGQGLELALGAATLVPVLQIWRTGDGRFSVRILVALSLQVGVFIGTAAGTPSLARFRLVQAMAIVAYAAILVSVLLVRMGNFAPRRAALLASAAALGVLGWDTIAGLGAPPNRIPDRWDWPDSADGHPLLGRVPRPYAAIKTYYPDDQQGYLPEEDVRARTWRLQVMPGSEADLGLPPEDRDVLRVAIRNANPDTTWHVQLIQSRFAIQSQVPYFITFRARADSPRLAAVGVAQNHPPWENLGLFQEVKLTAEWKAFREVFVSRKTDSNAMIAFPLAGSDIPVEVAAMTLHGPPAGRRIDPILDGGRFFIRHERNALGCRDHDYASPRPIHTVRVLALGDAFTAGIGVHEKDTFANLLEGELNNPALLESQDPGYEVINCGVSGYGTREQRLFYELFGATYRPEFVLVTMGWNDDRFYWEERQGDLLQRGGGRLEQLSSARNKHRVSRLLRRTYDYHRSVEDLLALGQAARAQGAQLIVVVSRHGPAGLGDSLLATVKKGLEGTTIPLLDLGVFHTADSGRADPRDAPGLGWHQAAAGQLVRWLRRDILQSSANHPRIP